MISKIKSSLRMKLMFLIIGGFLVSFIVFLIIGILTSSYVMNNYNNHSPEKLIRVFNVYSFTIVVLPITVFLIIFILGTRSRINYLKYISNQILDIENLRYIDKLEIKGSDEIASLATNINIMSKRILESYQIEKKAKEEKQEIITAVSHDLKTPLTSIIGYLDLIKTEGYSEEYLDIAYSKSIALKNLINELKVFNKMYRGDSARNSKAEGSGLGLAIVKNIVEDHDGKIFCNINNNKISIGIKMPI